MSTGKRTTTRSLPNVLELSEAFNKMDNISGIPNASLQLIGKVHSPNLTQPSTRLKLVVIGDKNCGKTSLLNSFVHHEFNCDCPRTFSDEVMTIRFGGKHFEYVIWDLSGCEEYDGLRCEFYKDADFFLVCYDIANKTSFQSVFENWIMELAKEVSRIPFVVVGCKQDVRNDCAQSMTVPKDEAERKSMEWGAKDYVECSARTGLNILKLFLTVAQHIIGTNLDEKHSLRNFARFQRKRQPKDLLTVAIGDGITENLYRSRINTRRASNFT